MYISCTPEADESSASEHVSGEAMENWRFEDITSPSEGFIMGRPEYFQEDQWRPICDDTYDNAEQTASVICRTLGMSGDGAWMIQSQAGPSDDFWFDDVTCNGDEASIFDCSYSQEDNCSSSETMYVACSTDGLLPVDWRFQDLTFPSAGQVMGRPEYNYEGEWRGICDDTYGETAPVAAAICRTMGLNGDGAYMTQSQSGPSGDFWFDNVECSAGASSIWDCTYTFGSDNCSASETMYVTCGTDVSTEDDTQDAVSENLWRFEDVTDVDGMHMGRPEFYNEGEWRGLCDDTYGDTSTVASVMCRTLGYSGDGAIMHQSQDGPSGDFWFDNVECNGSEWNILECDYQFGSDNCGSYETMYVQCNPSDGTSSSHTGMPQANWRMEDVTAPADGFVMGRPEYYQEGEWRGVCDDTYDNTQTVAEVMCRTLGFATEGASMQQSQSGPSGDFWFDNVECAGTEASILDCSYNALGDENCSASETMYVTCPTEGTSTSNWRLEDWSFPSAGEIMGRPEFNYNGEWRGLCDDTYQDTATVATVVCRTLGLVGEGAVMHQSMSGPSGDFWYDNIECNGSEWNVDECSFQFGEDNCSASETMYVTCGTGVVAETSNTTSSGGDTNWRFEDQSEDVTGMIRGRPEFFNEGEWRGVCDDSYENTEIVASVMCMTLGYSGDGAVFIGNMAGPSSDFWFDDVNCYGGETNISECSFRFGEDNCSSSETLYVMCQPA
jgi:hypothetical protein